MISFSTVQLQDLSIHWDEKCQEAPLEHCKQTDLNAPFCEGVYADTWGAFDYSCVDIMYLPRDE